MTRRCSEAAPVRSEADERDTTCQLARRDGQAGDSGLHRGCDDRGRTRLSRAADRIAAFDNDGTLWVEQPLPPQFDFVFGKWAQEVKADPALAQQQPYKAILERDPGFFQGLATQEPEVVAALLAAFGRSWAGTTPGEFEAQVREWMARVK